MMAVYVDNLRPCMPNRFWRYKQACHLLADTEEELHQFAEKIYLKRAWFQQKSRRIPHYDLTAGKRRLAVAKGAIPLSDDEFVERIRRFREI